VIESPEPIANDAPPLAEIPLAGERTETVRANGLRLLCRHWGDPRAPALVMLHGLRGYSGTWRGLAAALAGEYHLIAIDQRGRGQSDWDPGRNYYTDAYLSDLEQVVDQLGLGRFALLGHSMGGATAYIYAARHSQRLAALLIEDIAPGSSAEGPGAQRIVAEMATLPESFASWAEARRYWRTKRPTVSDAALEQRVAESMCMGTDGRVTWRYDARGIRQTRMHPDPARVIDLWPVVTRITVPTLIIRGEKSDFCPLPTVERICAQNPRLTSVTVPDASHYVHDDAPIPFTKHVRDFLMRCGWSPGALVQSN
jgi:pimeloyl-ACP methyl ester carboxylesterase